MIKDRAEILIIGFLPKTFMPYLRFYEKVLDSAGVNYDEVYFNRSSKRSWTCIQTACGIEYAYSDDMDKSLFGKLWTGLRYAQQVRRLIKAQQYKQLIVLTSESAAYLSGLLKKHYSARYLFDFRDLTFERHAFFRRLISNVIACSYATFFSSPGFLPYFATNEKALIIHNIGDFALADKQPAFVSLANKLPCTDERFVGWKQPFTTEKAPIHIGFIGLVRYPQENEALISAFCGDERFELIYYGKMLPGTDLAACVARAGATNVRIHPAYDNSEKEALYEGIDLINSLYSLASPEVRPALPNRLYDAALYRKPLLTTKGTFLAELVCERGLGLAVDPFTDDIHQAVCDYLADFSPEAFEANCVAFLAEVEADMALIRAAVRDFAHLDARLNAHGDK